MVKLSIRAIEKWSGKPIVNATTYVNGVMIMKSESSALVTKTDGTVSLDMTTGTADICLKAEKYEDTCQKINIVSNMGINMIMTPIVSAL